MLKLKLERHDAHGVMYACSIEGGRQLFALVEPDGVTASDPDAPVEPWRLYVLQGNCSEYAASLLHGLELGIAAVARWIAVELLKDPAPQAADEKVEGVRLVLLCKPDYCRLKRLADMELDDLGGIYQDSRQWNTVETRDMIPQRSVCATKEQALAVLIEHAAPWIAAALAKEMEP